MDFLDRMMGSFQRRGRMLRKKQEMQLKMSN